MVYKRKPTWIIHCEYCGKDYETNRKQTRYCSIQHQRKHRWEREHLFGVDKVQCLDCGRWYVKLGSHVIQSHGYKTAKEYRLEHGLDYKKGIIPESHRALLEDNVRENGTINNLEKGAKHRFVKGDGRASKIVTGHWKYKRENV